MNAKDPICGKKVNVTEARDKGLTLKKQGKLYYFCNNSCKNTFGNAPENSTNKLLLRPGKLILGIVAIIILMIALGYSNIKGSEELDYLGFEATVLPGGYANQFSFDRAKSNTIIDLEDGGHLNLTAHIVTKNINGVDMTMYAYNGMIPGPAIRVKQDSLITVNFTNNIDMETTIHWHGLRHNIYEDGVPGVSQEPVKPGESFEYNVYFPDDGIYWYHPHVREDIQQDAGLSGNMLVIPHNPYNKVNQEEFLVLDDILVDENGYMVPFGKDHANYALMGRFGNVMLVNGDTNYKLSKINKGDIVRFYITNVANARPFNISIPGAKMKLVGGDLGELEREEFVESVIIAPAIRAIVDVYFEESRSYKLMSINPHKEYTLGTITVADEETKNSYKSEFEKDLTNEHVTKDIKRFEKYFDKEVDYELLLTVNMSGLLDVMDSLPCHEMGGVIMGNCTQREREAFEHEEHEEEHRVEWEDDMKLGASSSDVRWIIEDKKTGKQGMHIGLESEIGNVVKIRLFNDPESDHPMQHPIHLHGQRFITTHIDGVEVENKVWSDTVLVEIGSTVDILVDVTNPGEWMMHCHIAEHMESGMMTTFKAI